MLLAIGLSIAIALLRGGNLSRLSQVHFRFPALILVGFGLQAAIFSPWWPVTLSGMPTDLLYIDSLILLVIAVMANLRVAGLKLLGLGLASNLLVIAANGGAMPISPEALRLAGETRLMEMLATQGRTRHLVTMTLSSPLWPLGDILVVPHSLPAPTVFSIGDVLIAAGAFWFVQGAMLGARKPSERVVSPIAARVERERAHSRAVARSTPTLGVAKSLDGEKPSWAVAARRRLRVLPEKGARRG